jgi:hypothetical protein
MCGGELLYRCIDKTCMPADTGVAQAACESACGHTGAPVAPQELVYYLGDPQIGFGTQGWQEDVARFAAVAAIAENSTGNSSSGSSSSSSGVVVAGDLVNVWDNSTFLGGFDAIWPAHFAPDRGGVHLVPGNHDVNSAATDAGGFLAQLAHYRASFGANYHAFATRFAQFVLVDSESLIVGALGLNGTADARVLNESETQWRWLEDQLNSSSAAAAGRSHRIIVTHHPPFLTSEGEAHQYFNWPEAPRRRFMALARAHGVRNILCGHTHTTTSRATADGIRVFTVAGTAKAFDGNGCGYMTLAINETAVDAVYHRLEDPSLAQCVGLSARQQRALDECAARLVPVEQCDELQQLQLQ